MNGIIKFAVKFFAIYFAVVFVFHQTRPKPENRTLVKENDHYYLYETVPGTDIPMSDDRQPTGQKGPLSV